MQQHDKTASDTTYKARLALALGALGVVYGDIGTSPLYAFRLSIQAAGGVSEAHVLGVLSLMSWVLMLVVTVKYVSIVMRVDNKGEGGILALTTLALRSYSKRGRRHRILLLLGLMGACLFYGDGVITPAISVLSAVEGLEVLAPTLEPYVVPVAVILLFALFMIQRNGTARVGAFFGPVIAIWFSVLALLGVLSVIQNPAVLWALDPRHAVHLLLDNPRIGFLVAGAVVLTVTGAEALYADLGHFGRRTIAVTWLRFVFPALLLNYYGQGALVLRDPTALENPFYNLAPSWGLVPLIVLATAATIIASQAVISGAFSLTHQAVQLGYLPRIRVRHTSAEARGQVYVPAVNAILLVLVVFVVLEFRSSDALGSAYGVAVTGAMLLDTVLATVALRVLKRWSWWLLVPGALVFLSIDVVLLSANLVKIPEGGWLPLALALAIMLVFTTWIAGRAQLLKRRIDDAIPLKDFLASSSVPKLTRVSGTAVYLVAEPRYTPTALLHNLKHNKVLHERVMVLAVRVEEVPHVPLDQRVTIEALPYGFYSITARYGFYEEPHIPRVLVHCRSAGIDFVLEETSFFVGREKLIARRGSKDWLGRRRLFIALHRATIGVTDYFRLPPNRVVELGGQIDL